MSRKPTKGQRALYALLQTNRGHEVASAQILAASGWQEETLRVQLSNGRFAPFLKPTATADKYRVTIAEDTGLPAFCAAISQSEANRRGPGTEYQPFPVQAIDDLERLTRERAGLTAKSNQVSRDAVQRKIAKVVADLRQHPLKRSQWVLDSTTQWFGCERAH